MLKALRENSKDHSHLSVFLAALHAWRADIRQFIPTLDDSGVENLIIWWFRWGHQNYPQLPMDIAVSTTLENNLRKKVHQPTPPLFHEVLHYLGVEDDSSDFNSQINNYFSDWIFAFFTKESCIQELLQQWVDHLNDSSEKLFFAQQLLKLKESNQSKAINLTAIDDLVVFGVPDLKIGIGEDARLLSLALNKAGYLHKSSENRYQSRKLNLFALPAPDILVKLASVDNDLFNTSYNIASCPWELPHWPKELYFILEDFNEIWVHSNFVLSSIPTHFHQKVFKYPQPVILYNNSSEGKSKSDFGLKENCFYVMVAFDFSSHVTRKNPHAAVEAFKSFNKKYPNTGLVIKTNNSKYRVNEYEELKKIVSDLENVVIIDTLLEPEDLHRLYSFCDCYLSLHRSEGFGRNIAEFMLLGKPCVVTGYSGNLDFCSYENCYLVDYQLTTLTENDYIFSINQEWAEPSITNAISKLEECYLGQDRDLKLQKAKYLIEEKFSIKAAADFLSERLNKFFESQGSK
jgi:glycosyltransferase involved in cell wall biosynthesis